MKKISLNLLILSVSLTFIVAVPGLADAQDNQRELPKSWQAFVEFHQNCNALGTFVTEGVTQDMWVGIDAGQKYTATYTLELSDDKSTIIATHRMAKENGDVISIGSGVQYWNAKTNKVMSSYSGFDQGKLFTGQSKLRSMDPDSETMEWEYVEKSKGKTSTYLQTNTQTSRNTKTTAVKKKSGGETWTEELTRAGSNAGKKSRRNFMQKLFRR